MHCSTGVTNARKRRARQRLTAWLPTLLPPPGRVGWERVIGVSDRRIPVEVLFSRLIERRSHTDAIDQIGVRDVGPGEGDEISDPILDELIAVLGLKCRYWR
jgi:hypothetical protein